MHFSIGYDGSVEDLILSMKFLLGRQVNPCLSLVGVLAAPRVGGCINGARGRSRNLLKF